MLNRLSKAASPYLRQHESNPVDWYEWGEEAFRLAVDEQKPIFLSIGYSSCHWCHVMAHESFEDSAVAEILNRSFVSIKVDREELPQIDETYMTAVQLSSGQGGWPMSVFLTPEKKPIFAGTYFPPEDRTERMGFRTLISRIEELWSQDRANLLKAADDFSAALTQVFERQQVPQVSHRSPAELIESTVESLLENYDPQFGGFKGAPKFPPHTAIEFLLRFSEKDQFDEDLRRRARHVAGHTLEAICLGGITDHVGGGFHRYSTDAAWHLPHFEKMLYDNALMIKNLAIAERLIPSMAAMFRQRIDRAVEWLKREMLLGNGAFGSALDADSADQSGHVEEGKFYVWTIAELTNLLGTDLNAFLSVFPCETEGNFLDEATRQKTGENLLHAREPYSQSMEEVLDRLLKVRSKRSAPLFDHKAIVAWNAMMIDALIEAGEDELALDCLKPLLEEVNKGPLCRVLNGVHAATLEDVAWLLVAIHRVQSATGFLPESGVIEKLTDELEAYRLNPTSSAFQLVRRDAESLFGTIVPVFDQPTPGGNSVAIAALIALRKLDQAKEALDGLSGWIQSVPMATESLSLRCLELLELQTSPLIWNPQSRILKVYQPGHTIQLDSLKINGKGYDAKSESGGEVDHVEIPIEATVSRVTVEVSFCRPDLCLPVRSYLLDL